MAQHCGFFNAEYHDGEYDRVYNAEQFAAYFASFIGNGVFGDTMDEMVVLARTENNMSIDASTGQAWINGWWYENDELYNIPIALADGILNRKDIVVIRWGNAERDMWLQVIQGEPAIEAVAPTIRRDADYFDLKLCEIDIPAGTSKITQALISDTRLDNNVCGFVTGLVDQIDTTALYLQFNQQFGDWFTAVKEQFEGDVPQILQTQIDDLFGIISNRIETNSTSTHAYSNKDYFIYANKFCKATKSIAIGDTISPGTGANNNCIYTTITQEIGTGGVTVVEELADIEAMTTFDGEAAGAKAVKTLNNGVSSLRSDVSTKASQTALQNEIIARANADATKVSKAGDVMSGTLTISTNQPILTLTRFTGGIAARSLHFFVHPNNNHFYIDDYIGGRYVGAPLSINADSRLIKANYELHCYGAIRAKTDMAVDNGWIDWFFNNTKKLSLHVNNANDPDAWVEAMTGALVLRCPEPYAVQSRSSIFESVNRDHSAGAPIQASEYRTWSTRLMKENIQSMTDKDGYKVLNLNPVHFDFKEKFGGEKNNIGLIAEETLNIIPEIVNIPEGYDESEFDENKGLDNKLLTIDYVKLTPYLVKLCQIQQRQIDELTKRVEELEESYF